MTYKTILAVASHVDDAKTVGEAAALLAQKQDAILIGRHVIPIVDVHFAYSTTFSGSIVKTYLAQLRETAEEIKTILKAAADRYGVTFEWELEDSVHADPSNGIIPRARTVDLVVIGQPTDDSGMAAFNVASDVALESGRPVLLIPKSGINGGFGAAPMVAWSHTKESARAAHDALPILRTADQVTVMTLEKSSADADQNFASADLSLTLARQGVKTKAAQKSVRGISVTDELFKAMMDEDCDMLVMGAFGHSRFYETLLGGTSKHVMSEMTAPVLFSH